MTNARKKIDHELITLARTWKTFITNNPDAYTRYQALPDEIKAQENQTVLMAKTAQTEIHSLIDGLPTDIFSDQIVFQNFPAAIRKTQERFHALHTEIKSSQQKLQEMRNEFDQLQAFIKPNEEKVSRHAYCLWKKNAYPKIFYRAIEEGKLNLVKETFTPELANRPDPTGYTPLVLALAFKRFDIAGWLLRKENSEGKNIVDPNLPVDMPTYHYHGITPLCAAILWGKQEQYAVAALMLLQRHGANIHIASKTNGFTPLHWAAHAGSQDCMEQLLRSDADQSALDDQRRTPFQVFSERHKEAKNFTAIQQLFKKYAGRVNPAPR